MLFLTFSALVANPKKTTLHGGQSRSWSAEQGKKIKRTSLAAPPPPPARCSFGEKKEEKKEEEKKITRRINMSLRRWSRSVSHPYKDSYDSSARPMGVASQNSTLPCAIATFLVTPGWIFDISLCENSINQISSIKIIDDDLQSQNKKFPPHQLISSIEIVAGDDLQSQNKNFPPHQARFFSGVSKNRTTVQYKGRVR